MPNVPTVHSPTVPPAGSQLPESRWVDLDGPVRYVDFGGPADGPLHPRADG